MVGHCDGVSPRLLGFDQPCEDIETAGSYHQGQGVDLILIQVWIRIWVSVCGGFGS